ncbi:MAG TPA: type II secretion system F family protein [Candidatus Omnitrophota bacterium]|nr:type II secretion system F family protein [Candidatus Omnitrophota bacterium]HPN56895.1 type II secretion system F family protein [Candidatus Omnitrophota bacterium]
MGVKRNHQRVKFADLNMFTRQLYTLKKAGLPMLLSLQAIRDQTENLVFRDVIKNVAEKIEGGSSLSEALAMFPAVFNSIYVNMVRSGEVAGKLEHILERLATLGEHDEKIRLHIQSAMRYPLIVVVTLIMGFVFLILFVVPKFTNMFAKFDTALPLPTQMLLLIYNMIVHFWWMVLIVVGLLSFAFFKIVQTRQGRLMRDKALLRLPVFGSMLQKISLSRFCRITSTLLKSGVPILTILDLVKGTSGNTVIAEAIENIKNSVNDGKGMLAPMKASGLFPPVVTQMVSVGEETGKLDELLVHVADYYDSQVEYTINNLVSMIEPVLIIFLGSTVLFLALGIFMPMWSLMKLFK